MPPATPRDMMRKLTTTATMTQGALSTATTSKVPLMTAISCPMAYSSPVKAMAVYLKIQPMTTE